ncbi:hypothetical protein [Xenorhabdus bovienii]|uniref:hypothetical protein n=1 Tax=Xenorhabdus bovienii TaxID=40576 RepID=UPI0023B33672|nr:hypothetical protein [Xenorhabdus bovienii]MDE9458799.1 hypothetical protein [Xenorhabdus bovienii]MDE9487152.1 hypothetical protein [Xenorhabdus bovienii]MDE9515030.1 hypothetical protein [Xenorhabdus bovienii]MDE9538113.1 hypothetical protein [Xenorhabdus bovienii]MDE9549450.1 hypothetical protein [Xenorhabdus bovienii]
MSTTTGVKEQEYDVKTFQVHYGAEEGSALSAHKMNAYDLGMSIVEFSKMLNRADDIINKGKTLVLEVTAPAKPGSLIIEFAMTVKESGALEVLKYLGLSAASGSVALGTALGVAAKLKDKKIIGLTSSTKSNTTTIELEDGELKCDKTVAILVSDPIIRQAMNEIINQPLSTQEKPNFKITSDGANIYEVKDDEVLDFTPLPRKSLSHENIEQITTNVLITQVNFDSSKGWKMFYDDKEISVRMDDQSFMQRVKDSTKSFTKGDMFEVLLSVVTKNTARSQRTEYIIDRVIRHRASTENKIV